MEMRSELKLLKEQLEDKAVVMGGVTFQLSVFCSTWLKMEGATDLACLFVDAISMLSLITSEAHNAEHGATKLREFFCQGQGQE